MNPTPSRATCSAIGWSAVYPDMKRMGVAGPDAVHVVGELRTAHVRHHDVREHEVDVPPMRVQVVDALLAVAAHEDVVARGLERPLHGTSDAPLVLDQQDGLAPTANGLLRSLPAASGGPSRTAGSHKSKRVPLPGLVSTLI